MIDIEREILEYIAEHPGSALIDIWNGSEKLRSARPLGLTKSGVSFALDALTCAERSNLRYVPIYRVRDGMLDLERCYYIDGPDLKSRAVLLDSVRDAWKQFTPEFMIQLKAGFEIVELRKVIGDLIAALLMYDKELVDLAFAMAESRYAHGWLLEPGPKGYDQK